MFKYSINLIWSNEDDCYVATIPEFPYLSAFGDTPEKAVEEAKTAAMGFVEVMTEDGDDVPTPKVLSQYSGQIRLRLPKSLHKELSLQAKNEGVSLNTYLIRLLSENNLAEKVDKKIESIRQAVYSGADAANHANAVPWP